MDLLVQSFGSFGKGEINQADNEWCPGLSINLDKR